MPPRGGQRYLTSAEFLKCAFQYMPPRGGQPGMGADAIVGKAFQYMPPRGGQQSACSGIPAPEIVSIHAPTRGATRLARAAYANYPRFNTCPHAGGNMDSVRVQQETGFQYMPPRGGQPVWGSFSLLAAKFQYMPPRGGQPASRMKSSTFSRFQYMPPRGGQHFVDVGMA